MATQKTTSVSLGDHFIGFIGAQIEEGRYKSASEVMRAALRLLEDQEAREKALRQAIQEGIDSGPTEPFDLRAFIDEELKSL